MDPNAFIENFRSTIVEHYFDMKGRAARPEFWFFILGVFAINLVLSIFDAFLTYGVLCTIVILGLILPITGLAIRRMQDTGRDGTLVWIWAGLTVGTQLFSLIYRLSYLSYVPSYGFGYYGYIAYTVPTYLIVMGTLLGLLGLATFVMSVILIIFWSQPGTVGPNQYGPDPKQPAA